MSSWLCSLPVIAGLVGCGNGTPLAVGYVEGEYVLVAPIATAQIASLDVARGSRVDAGAPLATMEMRDAEIAVAQAQAALARAESQLLDLQTGRRNEEITVLETTLDSARAQARQADISFERVSGLLEQRVATQSAFDDASAARDVARAAVAQAEANLDVARLPARDDQIAAAHATVDQAHAALEQAQWQLDERRLTAPADGIINDVIRYSGEVAGPQAPVLSMLPDGAIKVRLYVPQSALSSLSIGSHLNVRCDGCADDLTATVSYIADDPEFTPPVIYSLESRQKLVWLIEARPDGDVSALKPGQIVDADLRVASP